MKEMLENLSEIGRQAGSAILEVYAMQDPGIETKSDDSPLTKADMASHHIIVDELSKQFPDIPVLSEESEGLTWSERSVWREYFLVDPLDGTKEFINRNGEFTVNIALIEDGVPVLGMVYVPVKDVLYTGYRHEGEALAQVHRDGTTRDIRTRSLKERMRSGAPLTVVASRRHGSETMTECMEALDRHFAEVETRNMGSSLKLCLVAEGEADLYPRLAPTSEWDTAAAHAVVEAAGGTVVDMNLMPLRYNQKEDILNPYFYVLGDTSFPWQDVLGEVPSP
jgi:3'(2'), 5'-bisphosphate nucleotidase